MKALLGVSLAFWVAVAGACGLFPPAAQPAPGLPPDASAAQVTADDVLQSLTLAWNVSAQVCLSLEDAGSVASGECSKALMPAYDGLLAAANSIDAWNAGQSGKFTCAVASVVRGLIDIELVFAHSGAKIPTEVTAAISLVQGLGNLCSPLPSGG